MGLHISNFWFTIPIFFLATYFINYFSDILGDKLCLIGKKLHIPNDVRGATFDSISSSLPELITALIAVLMYNQFEDIGFATVAGSGIFNILLIPMLALLFYKGFSKKSIELDRSVIKRDMFFYTGALGILATSYFLGALNYYTGVVLLIWYSFYILILYIQTKQYRLRERHEQVDEGYFKLIAISALMIIGIYVSIDTVVHSAIVFSKHLNIPQYIVSLIILASCTSIPDTFLSIKSSKEGDLEGSLANAVGSNIFDISVCLGLPIILYGKSMPVNLLENSTLFLFLIGSMLITSYVLMKKNIRKSDSVYMALFYVIFLIVIIYQGFGG